jgi:tripartite-type tricarboxylate transporter receptor subunit TctC
MFVLAFGLVFVSDARQLSAQEPFYKGKVIRIIVATAAGGGFDTYTRVIARHMGRYIPGNPTIIVENMPGAGQRIGANYVYKASKPDGLTIGHFQGGLFLEQLLGGVGIEFDALKFEFIGAPVKDNRACAFTKASGITSMEKWMASKTPVKLGGIGGGATDDVPKMLKATIGLPIQLVAGYKGTSEIRLAAEGGEIAGGCWTWDSIRATWTKAIESGEAVVVLQILPKPHPQLPNVPLAISYAKTDEARELIKVGIQDPSAYYRPYVLPPGTPSDRVQTLRRAFLDALKDPELLAEAKKARLDIEPVTADEIKEIVTGLSKLSAGFLAKLREILIQK